MITEANLRALWPQADSRTPGLVTAAAAAAPVVFPKYGWRADLEIGIAIAQISHEFGGGAEMLEDLDYRAARIVEVWPSRFHSVSEAAPYAHSPQKLANQVYNGRMGNRPGTNDGYDYRGRGGAQITGRDEYAATSRLTGLDLVGTPDLAIQPAHFLEVAVAVLTIDGCLPYARQGNFRMVTQRLNGGQTGAAERLAWWNRVRRVLGIPSAGGRHSRNK